VPHCSPWRSAPACRASLRRRRPIRARLRTPPSQGGDQVEADSEEIVVTGFRRSVESSIAVKRDTDFIVDVVTAEDIAGLPDVSIAESLARLPGVTSQRTGGQASAINIRGLSQDLVSATLNGREQVATSGNRVIEFDQYPSELLSQAAVYKTPIARLIEGGVAGKVELQTARPLASRKDFSVTLNLRGSYNDRADESPDVSSYGYRASGSVQAKLLDDTLGLALGYARLYQPNVATRFVQFDFTPAGQNGAPTLDLDGNGVPERRGFGFEGIQFGGRETRDAVIGVVQYEPVDSLRILVDGYYSRFKSDVARRGLRVVNPQSGDTIITNPVIVNDAIVGGTFTNRIGQNGFGFALGTELVNQDESRRDELYTIGGNIAYDFSDRITGALDVSYSRGESFFNNSGVNVRPFTQTPTGLRRTDQVPGAISVDYRLNGLNLPTVNNISTDFTNANAFRFDGLFIVPQRDIDELFAVAADFTVDVDGPFVNSFQFGGRYSKRDGERIITSFRTFGPDGGAPLAIPADLFRVAGFGGAFGRAGLPNFGVVDIDGLLDLGVGEERIADQEFGFTRDQSFTIKEDTYAGYAQLNFASVLGSLPVRGNLGLRVVRTEQGSTPAGTSAAGLFIGDEYTDFLPSANIIIELSPEDLLRISATRQISRPRFFELRGSIGVGTDAGGVPSGGGGNPTLRPYRANQFDIRTSIISARPACSRWLLTTRIWKATSSVDRSTASTSPASNSLRCLRCSPSPTSEPCSVRSTDRVATSTASNSTSPSRSQSCRSRSTVSASCSTMPMRTAISISRARAADSRSICRCRACPSISPIQPCSSRSTVSALAWGRATAPASWRRRSASTSRS
jgi:phosphoribosylformimino-5-aminoimidazole carboxamide ribotide isomerase